MNRYLSVSTLALGVALLSAEAHAAPDAAAAVQSEPSTEVIVTGTRQTGVKAADSAAPIEIVGASALSRVGQPDLIQSLAQNIPSFTAQAFGGDTSNLTLSASLRGLNPNDTLVLVDGKRRHGTSNLAVGGGSSFQGAATTDLSFIPVGAIDHVEVLQDGAAAQYGSDAIAGVVNIITRKASTGGSLSATGGEYFKGDGATGAWTLNKGFDLWGRGYLNVTGEERYHGFSQTGGADYRYYDQTGAFRTGQAAVNASGIPTTSGAPNVNPIIGDAAYNIYNLFFTAGYDLGGGVELYADGSYGHRSASSNENYRPPNKVSGVTSTGVTVYPFAHGFVPREAIDEDDFSFTGGIRGLSAGWNWDLSTTYGQNQDKVSTINSANAQQFAALQSLSATPIAAQTNFYDGSFTNAEWTSNLDLNRGFEVGLASRLNVAFGGQVQRNEYSIGAGDAASIYGAGAQSYPGFEPTDAGTHSRTSEAAYLDLSVDPIRNLHTDLAGRYEHYSDFGSTEVGKFTARYDFSPAFALRGTISSGFRAPTLAEEYYSATNVSPTSATVQLPSNSAAAKAAGFAPLKPEQSDNYSIGLVAHPLQRLQITLDAYEIDIRDRIVGSGFLTGTSGTTVISPAVVTAIETARDGQPLDSGLTQTGLSIFTNGANTQTRGVEATANYASDFGDFGHVDWSVGLNYNETKITATTALPAAVTNASVGQTAILTPLAISALTDATPKAKAVLGALWTHGGWTVNLRETVYGPTSEVVSISGTGVNGVTERIGTTAITDLEIAYKITAQLRLSLGANNLFDTKPPTVANVLYNGVVRPVDGGNVYGAPLRFSPFGINGGYYYGRVTYTF